MKNYDLKTLELIMEELNKEFDTYLEFKNHIWCCNENGLSWNTDNNKDHLSNGDGNTYSAEIEECAKKIGQYIFFNVQSGQGYTQTLVFDQINEEFWFE